MSEDIKYALMLIIYQSPHSPPERKPLGKGRMEKKNNRYYTDSTSCQQSIKKPLASVKFFIFSGQDLPFALRFNRAKKKRREKIISMPRSRP